MTDTHIDKINNGLESLGLIFSYCIEADGRNYWPIDKKFISEIILKVPFKKNKWKEYNVERDVDKIKNLLRLHSI